MERLEKDKLALEANPEFSGFRKGRYKAISLELYRKLYEELIRHFLDRAQGVTHKVTQAELVKIETDIQERIEKLFD